MRGVPVGTSQLDAYPLEKTRRVLHLAVAIGTACRYLVRADFAGGLIAPAGGHRVDPAARSRAGRARRDRHADGDRRREAIST